MIRTIVFGILLLGIFVSGCQGEEEVVDLSTKYNEPVSDVVSRNSQIPSNMLKITLETDSHPPHLHSEEWEEPVPLPALINTAGAEDSPFVTPNGNTLYFFFTPDPNIPAERQLLDGVTGIWVTHKSNGRWQEPQRVILQDKGKLALDGCTFVQDDTMWFCSVREGYTGVRWFTASYVNGEWTSWQNDDFNAEYEVGELHFTNDKREVYFHSSRAGGKGGYDIWVSRWVNGVWQEPENLAAVNSDETEGWPCLSSDGDELWFSRTYLGSPAVYRSKKSNNCWQEPELIISQFAGEPSIDSAQNLYFVHHFYKDGQMIEADIYVAGKKSPETMSVIGE